MMTSAAPTYFPAYRLQGLGSCYIDGGVFANNPSHIAVTKIQVRFFFFALGAQFTLAVLNAALSSCLPHAQAHIGARISPSNFSVLSVGSGSFNFNIHAEKKDSMDWGLRQWAPHLINLVLDRCARFCCRAPRKLCVCLIGFQHSHHARLSYVNDAWRRVPQAEPAAAPQHSS